MFDIFISYVSDEKARVRPLVDALRNQGWTVFWAEDLPVGTLWRQELEQRLMTSKCVVVVWTKLSASHDRGSWVQDEAERAKERHCYLPVRLDDIDPPLGFGGVQVLDLQGFDGGENQPDFVNLVDAIQSRFIATLSQNETQRNPLTPTSSEADTPVIELDCKTSEKLSHLPQEIQAIDAKIEGLIAIFDTNIAGPYAEGNIRVAGKRLLEEMTEHNDLYAALPILHRDQLEQLSSIGARLRLIRGSHEPKAILEAFDTEVLQNIGSVGAQRERLVALRSELHTETDTQIIRTKTQELGDILFWLQRHGALTEN